jgi:hypothetical protein
MKLLLNKHTWESHSSFATVWSRSADRTVRKSRSADRTGQRVEQFGRSGSGTEQRSIQSKQSRSADIAVSADLAGQQIEQVHQTERSADKAGQQIGQVSK